MSRQAWKGSGDREIREGYKTLMARELKNEFKGYDCLEMHSQIIALIQDGQEVNQTKSPQEIELVAAETPFDARLCRRSGTPGWRSSFCRQPVTLKGTP